MFQTAMLPVNTFIRSDERKMIILQVLYLYYMVELDEIMPPDAHCSVMLSAVSQSDIRDDFCRE